MAKNLQEYIEQQTAQPKANELQQVNEQVVVQERKKHKFEKIAFDYANTMWKRGGCFTSAQMNEARAVIQGKIDKGEIKI